MSPRVVLVLAALFAAPSALLAQVNFKKVMISEVSWGEPDCIELTNFSDLTKVLIGWTLTVRIQGVGDFVSDPIIAILAPGRSLYVRENSLAPDPPLSLSVQYSVSFPTDLPLGSQAFCVALKSEFGFVQDEVNVTDSSGNPGATAFNGFAGHARRGVNATSITTGSVERISALDSDRGSDWTEHAAMSLSLENLNSGLRGTDTTAVVDVWLNEIAVGAVGYLELYRSGTAIDLADWFVLVSNAQDSTVVRRNPFPAGTLIGGATPYVVLGETSTPPTELPLGTSYLDAGSFGLTAAEYSVALYDSLGRCVDLVRATAVDSELVHNEPRLPSANSQFLGAARRSSPGGSVLGRTALGRDGAAFGSFAARTMGSANGLPVGAPGHADPIDVRVNDGLLQNQGVHLLIDAPDLWQGNVYALAPSLFHSFGTGPVLGLGADAPANFITLLNVPPFYGTLDAKGAARFDFDGGTFFPGVDIDVMVLVFTPGGVFVGRTLCLAYDS